MKIKDLKLEWSKSIDGHFFASIGVFGISIRQRNYFTNEDYNDGKWEVVRYKGKKIFDTPDEAKAFARQLLIKKIKETFKLVERAIITP